MDAISNWLDVFAAPEIVENGKDSRFTGEVFRGFCTAHNVVLQTVIPGHHLSLGATGRRRGLFRSIICHAIGNKNQIVRVAKNVRIRGNGDVALKFPSAAIWRFRAGETSFRAGAQNADMYDW